jgi:hypothetical protein
MGVGDRSWITSAGVGEGGRDPRSASQPEPQSILGEWGKLVFTHHLRASDANL